VAFTSHPSSGRTAARDVVKQLRSWGELSDRSAAVSLAVVPLVVGFVIAVAVFGLITSDLRHRRRVIRRHPSAAVTTVADEVEKWLRDRG
jgi:hypothetical protein